MTATTMGMLCTWSAWLRRGLASTSTLARIHSTIGFTGQLLQDGAELLTRAAPVRPQVDDDGGGARARPWSASAEQEEKQVHRVNHVDRSDTAVAEVLLGEERGLPAFVIGRQLVGGKSTGDRPGRPGQPRTSPHLRLFLRSAISSSSNARQRFASASYSALAPAEQVGGLGPVATPVGAEVCRGSRVIEWTFIVRQQEVAEGPRQLAPTGPRSSKQRHDRGDRRSRRGACGCRPESGESSLPRRTPARTGEVATHDPTPEPCSPGRRGIGVSPVDPQVSPPSSGGRAGSSDPIRSTCQAPPHRPRAARQRAARGRDRQLGGVALK